MIDDEYRQDILMAMIVHLRLCEDQGMTTKQIEREFSVLIRRAMRTAHKESAAAR